ncbi:DUF4870 domain-containing protein [Phycisphaeraceae bacterium D3-23]
MSDENPNTPPEDAPAPDAAPPPPADAPAADAPAISGGDIPDDAKTMAMLCHLLGLTMIGTIIIWLIKKDDHPFIDQEGKEATNFQITALIGWVIASVIAAVTCGIGGILYLPLMVCVVIFCIMGALKAKEGEAYRYPVNIRFIK